MSPSSSSAATAAPMFAPGAVFSATLRAPVSPAPNAGCVFNSMDTIVSMYTIVCAAAGTTLSVVLSAVHTPAGSLSQPWPATRLKPMSASPSGTSVNT